MRQHSCRICMAQLPDSFFQVSGNFTLLALFLAVFLWTFGLPVPGETILITTAVISSQGDVSIYFVGAVAIFASIARNSVAFLIGR